MAKLVYLAHPIAGDVQGNIASVLRICREVHSPDVIPVVPYIPALQYLNDDSPAERALGMSANKEYFDRRLFDELWLCGPRISSGMREEVVWCRQLSIPVLCYSTNLAPDLEQVLREIAK